MKLLITALLLCSLLKNSAAQAPTFDWATHIGDSGSVYSRSMTLDDFGNIYTTGVFISPAMDFDPGEGTYELSTTGSIDLYITKSDADGGFIWAKSLAGTNAINGQEMAIDESGNVYFTGYFSGVADFDPGPGEYELTSNGGNDIFLCKLDADGDFVWSHNMGGSSADVGESVALDASGNVYVSGYFEQSADFDPSVGDASLTSSGSKDMFISKYDPSGSFQWVKQIGSTNNEIGQAMILDNASNIFLTGGFTETVDFDPGSNVFDLTTTEFSNCFVLKLDSSGDFVWATQLELSSSVRGTCIALDDGGDVYVAGGGAGESGIMISKLNGAGGIMWSHLLAGTNCNNCAAQSIALDAAGNAYTTGSFENTIDFDPGSGIAELSTTGYNAFLNKLDASGNYLWAYSIGVPPFDDSGTSIALNDAGSIYGFGHYRNTTDFDPSANVFELDSWVYDTYILKWNQSTMGIDGESQALSVELFPNPTDGMVQFNLFDLKDVSIRVYSSFGQLIHQQKNINDPRYQFELDGTSGIYFVEVIAHGQSTHFKLIKN